MRSSIFGVLVIGLSAAGTVPVESNEWTPTVVVGFSAAAAEPVSKPKPDDNKCQNCNGTGVLGDGTVKIKCPECDGTGKKIKENAKEKTKKLTTKEVAKPEEKVICKPTPTGQS